jgi:uncharacterized protein YlxP (DUF503 family)
LITIVITAKLELPGVTSLKDKRRILKSLLTRLRNDFNVSVAEVDLNDVHRSAVIGAAVVCNDTAFGHSVMSKVVNRIEANSNVLLADIRTETY